MPVFVKTSGKTSVPAAPWVTPSVTLSWLVGQRCGTDGVVEPG